MPKITASVTIAPITPATPSDMLVLDEDPVTVLLLFASPSASGLHKPVVLPQA
jgi:hypothetical protein